MKLIEKDVWERVCKDNRDVIAVIKTMLAVITIIAFYILTTVPLGNYVSELYGPGAAAAVIIVYVVGTAVPVWLIIAYIKARKALIEEARRALEKESQPDLRTPFDSVSFRSSSDGW